MCIWIYVYMHTCIHAQVYSHLQQTNICIYAHMYACISVQPSTTDGNTLQHPVYMHKCTAIYRCCNMHNCTAIYKSGRCCILCNCCCRWYAYRIMWIHMHMQPCTAATCSMHIHIQKIRESCQYTYSCVQLQVWSTAAVELLIKSAAVEGYIFRRTCCICIHACCIFRHTCCKRLYANIYMIYSSGRTIC